MNNESSSPELEVLEAKYHEVVREREAALQAVATATLQVAQLKDYLRWGPRSVYSRAVAEMMGWQVRV